MAKQYSKLEKVFIELRKKIGDTNIEIADAVNLKFNNDRTESGINSLCSRNNWSDTRHWYTKEEKDYIKELKSLAFKNIEIADKVNIKFNTDRNENTIKTLCTKNSWISPLYYTNDEDSMIIECISIHKMTAKDTAKAVNIIFDRKRTTEAIFIRCNKVLHIKCKNREVLNNDIIDNDLIGRDIKRLSDYPGSVKEDIEWLCLKCDNTWIANAGHVCRTGKTGCPTCANYGFNPSNNGQCYFIYFPKLNLYKIGISNTYKRRLKEFGYIAEICKVWEFDIGADAKLLEKKLHHQLKDYKINTGKLLSGNTETFKLSGILVNKIIGI